MIKKLLTGLLSSAAFFCWAQSPQPALNCRVYFTEPHKKNSRYFSTNPESGFEDFIDRAENTIDGAFYEISSERILDAFLRALSRGVKVRLVTDSDYYARASVTRMIRAGGLINPDRRPGLMHNKFAVADGRRLWTGSYNLTYNGAVKNNNNALLIESGLIAEIYLHEFREMFENGIFGNSRENGPFAGLLKQSKVLFADAEAEIYFSPEDSVESIIAQKIEGAEKSIRFMAFSFTSELIGEALIKKYRQGLDVKGIFERRGSNTPYSEYTKMKIEGISAITDKNRANMHHKVIIIDENTVITGSFNFSKNADSTNDENIIIIKNPALAGKYLKEFDSLYK